MEDHLPRMGDQEEPRLIPICAWCGRARRPSGAWGKADRSMLDGPITHGICPACAVKVMAETQNAP